MKTRKSSCVNARGIPTVAYQVLHLLSCTGGVPHSCWGYPILGAPIRPGWEYPIPATGGGVLHLGYPIRPGWGYPIPATGGYPTLDTTTRPGWVCHLRYTPSDLAGVPPRAGMRYPPTRPGRGTLLPRGGQTDTCENSTLPPTTYVVCNNFISIKV